MRKKLFAELLAVVLILTMMPVVVFAESSDRDCLEQIGEQIQDPYDDPFDYKTSKVKLRRNSSSDFPEQFDLRDQGLVTPVKFQNPFGTCWGFAAIAAAESSILGSPDPEVRGDYTKDTLDLSEKHLVYFVSKAIDDPDNPQNGEGSHSNDNVSLADKMNQGGLTFMATNLFASGLGPVVEDDGYEENTLKYMGKDGSIEYRMVDGKLTEYSYDDEDDWSLPEEYRFLQTFVLKESYMLPSPAQTDPETGEYTYNPEGTKAIKEMLMNNRAVSIGFCADTSLPSQEAGDGQYISTNWAHYTYDAEEHANHAVTVIGWDDNYPAENFIEGHEPKDENGNLLNGAWLIKNSWGSEEEEFPNKGPGWGLENEKGEHTGYFWLSYYDKTLDSPEALEFDRNNQSYNEGYWVDAHDYMPANDIEGAAIENETKMSNVFKARACQSLEGVSCQTSYPGTKVVSEVYLLPDGFKDPTDGILVSTVEGEYTYGGFHKMILDTPVLIQKGQHYSIVQTQTIPDGEYAVNMPMSLNKTFAIASGEDTWLEGVVNKGESFMYSGGKWYDYTDESLVDKMFGDTAKLMTFDNFPIKGYCRMQPDISIRVSGNTPLDLYGNNQTILRVSFKGHDGHAVQSDCEWELAEGGSDLFDIERDPADSFRVRVTAKAIGCANLFVTVKGAGTTVVPLSVQKLELFSMAIFDDEIIYNGNALKPKVEVYDIADNVISPEHYTLKYTNNTKCGTAKVTATAKKDDTEYTGSHEMEFLISPAKAVIKSLVDGKNSLTITVKDQKASGVKGYEVSYRIKGSSAWKTKNFKATSNKLVLTNLKKGKKYQVRVRATEGYHEDLEGDNFGDYSAVQTSSKIGIAPSKPLIRSLKAGKGSLTVKLKGETPAGVKSYKVQYRIKGTKKWTTKTFKASGTKLVIRKLTKGKKYQVRIRAVKHSGLVSKYSKTKTSKKIK